MPYFAKYFGDIKEYPTNIEPHLKNTKDLATERSWLMQESPGLNPKWFEESTSFLEKILNEVFSHKQVEGKLDDSFW